MTTLHIHWRDGTEETHPVPYQGAEVHVGDLDQPERERVPMHYATGPTAAVVVLHGRGDEVPGIVLRATQGRPRKPDSALREPRRTKPAAAPKPPKPKPPPKPRRPRGRPPSPRLSPDRAAALLDELRQRGGLLSDAALARALGVSRQSVSIMRQRGCSVALAERLRGAILPPSE